MTLFFSSVWRRARDEASKASGLADAVASMSAGDADSLEAVVCLLHAVSAIKGSSASTKEALVQTVAEILFPWAAREMRSMMLQALMDFNEEVFVSAYSTGPSNDPHGRSDHGGSVSPPHIGPEDSAVINSLTFDCVAALFDNKPSLTFQNILHLSPGTPPRDRAAVPKPPSVEDDASGALPHPEGLPAWVGQVVRNNNVAARFNRKQLIRVCKGVRSEIQQFESEFQATHGRKPSPGADRAPIADKYENYRALKKFVRANAACKIQATYRGYLGRKMTMGALQGAREAAAASNNARRAVVQQPVVEVVEPLRVETVVRQPVEPPAAVEAPAGTGGVKLSGYLTEAHNRLETERLRVSRPSTIGEMNVAQLEDEKTFIKYELKRFDDLLGAELGRALKKADKEPMRPLYSRYHEIKNLLAAGTAAPGAPAAEETNPSQDQNILQDASNKAAVAPAPKAAPEPRQEKAPPAALAEPEEEKSYQQLKQEKRTLQQKLHQYESEFLKKHGRKMKHHEDIAPVQHEYTEYKRLKGVLSQMEAQGLNQ